MVDQLLQSINVEAVAGFSAGFVTTAALYPLDVIKVRFQSGIQKEGTLASLLYLRYKHSRFELYRGFLTGLTGSSLSWCQYFFLYSSLKSALQTQQNVERLSPFYHLSASFAAGCVVQATLCPLWVVKVNQQLGIFDSFWGGIRTLHRSEGVSGLYRGIVPGLWSCMHGAVQFAVYEELRSFHGEPPSVVNTLLATVASKTAATLITSPIEVIKTRMRMASTRNFGLVQSIRAVWNEAGIVGFYRGMVPALLRLMPAQCLMFITYEGVKARLDQLTHNRAS